MIFAYLFLKKSYFAYYYFYKSSRAKHAFRKVDRIGPNK